MEEAGGERLPDTAVSPPKKEGGDRERLTGDERMEARRTHAEEEEDDEEEEEEAEDDWLGSGEKEKREGKGVASDVDEEDRAPEEEEEAEHADVEEMSTVNCVV